MRAFEQPEEFARLADGLARAHAKWPTGIYVLWYPIKDRAERDAFARQLGTLAIPRILRAELRVAPGDAAGLLTACGLIIVNPPFRLDAELDVMGPALAAILGRDGAGESRLDWIAREK